MTDAAALRARTLALALLLLLLALMAVETLLLAPAEVSVGARVFVLTLKVLPLLLFVWPLWQRRVRPALWLSFVLMLYFVWSVLSALAPGLEGQLAVARSVLVAATFLATVYFARWQGRLPAA
ncbi:MAG: DUF2069 domain-containing protein [Moraxellaceae bacterium]|nr:DUF2069 domain-containing protein [Moraxellaceae bacterium]